MPVVSLTSDGAKPNRRFYKLSEKAVRENSPILNIQLYRELTFCDAPHLLKTARNCFLCTFQKPQNGGMSIIIIIYEI